ncbi:MAG: SDR family oxidoreductase [Anaerolineales bacterium]
MDLGLEGKVALVSAASRGLGKSAALALAAEGADIAMCARSESIHSTAKEVEAASGQRAWSIQADLTRDDQVQAFVNGALEEFGQLDILIINAGGPPAGGFLDFTLEDWRAAIDLTIMSAVRLCYSAVPPMIEAGSGSIVATESYSVKQPIDNLILSNSLRLAVIGMMKTLANELGPKGIRVNSINPTWTQTERVDELMADRVKRNDSSVKEEKAKLATSIPLGRIGTVEEYGRTIAWLASPAASFIHGHALMFDGGEVKTPL